MAPARGRKQLISPVKQAIRIKQHDLTDCGAACLASIAAYHGLFMPLARIRHLASTDRQGTSLLGMVKAAEKLGFHAKPVRGSKESIPYIPCPSIAHLNMPNGLQHFVVIYRIGGRYITLMDPATGKIDKKKLAEFEQLWTGALILLNVGDGFRKGNFRQSVLSRFMKLLHPHRNVLLQAGVGAALYSIMGLATSIYIQKIIDFVLVDRNVGLLRMMSLFMVFILLARFVIGIFKNLFILKTGQSIDAGLVTQYFNHLLRLPQSFIDGMRTGELISRVTDAVKIRVFINDIFFKLLLSCMILVVTFVVIFLLSWKLAAILLGLIPAFGLLYLIINRINKKYLRRIMEDNADLESHFVESISQNRTIKLQSLHGEAGMRTEARLSRLLGHIYKAGRTSILSGETSALISALCIIVLFWTGSGIVLDREITPGGLMSVYALFGYMIQPLNQLLQANSSLQDAMIAADRLFQIIDLETEIPDQPQIIMRPEMTGDIQFTGVSFRYGSREYLFRDLNCIIPSGLTTSIVGESGSGKSTLIGLIQRLYRIDSGKITIGGVNIDQLHPGSIRKYIATVSQRTELFSGSIIENITSFQMNPDLQTFHGICEALSLNELFDQLPQGFNSIIHENGDGLSGGEKQKIALARALYMTPKMLLLDEATSSMDPKSETNALNAIKAYAGKGKTVVMISHQIRNSVSSDHVILLERGNVKESGSYEALRKAGSTFDGLCRLQGLH